jgi:hypothetical protein
MVWTNDQLIALLEAIKTLAMLPYPFRDDSPRDPALVLAIGEIGGRAMRALKEAHQPPEPKH